MRTWLLAIILGTALTLGVLAPADTFAAATPGGGSATGASRTEAVGLASFAGTRVKVQLVTLGAALVLVVCVGSAAYFVRKRLGLDAQTPPEDPSSSQH